ncbi:MAG: ParB/RepB/Spo0J family partition protein [Gammaproteobacteria bacterium]
MATKKRGLGRGLDALLGSTPAGHQAKINALASAGRQANTHGELRTLGIEQLQRGKYQPRKDMHAESLDDLADSIRAQGVVQPIVVRPVSANQYEIIAGERRWRAAQLADLKDVPVVIRDIDDRAAIAIALIENIQRENLNPLEEAHALSRLIEEFEMTHQQAAEAVGRSRAAVSNLLRLLDLGAIATQLVQDGKLEMGHARALLGLTNEQQNAAAQKVADGKLTVRATESLVKNILSGSNTAKSMTSSKKDPNLVRLEKDLSDKLGAATQIQYNKSGRGKLTVSYNTLDELDGILEHIR